MSSSSFLLSVPLKRTSDVDLVKPLRNAISASYSGSKEATLNLGDNLNEFMKLRRGAISADRSTESGFNAIAK